MLRRDWLLELILLVAVATAVTLIFAVTPLDIVAARVFFRPAGADHWPLAKQFPWSFLYALASPITGSLIVLGLVWIVARHERGRVNWRAQGVFLMLSVVIGPGLIVNTVFKDHWNRPRPREIVEFGGPMHYTPPPLRGEGGESFPCGHCSVGFLYASGWWVRDELAATAGKKSADAIPRELAIQYVMGAYMAVMTWWLDGGAKLPPQRMALRIFEQLAQSAPSPRSNHKRARACVPN